MSLSYHYFVIYLRKHSLPCGVEIKVNGSISLFSLLTFMTWTGKVHPFLPENTNAFFYISTSLKNSIELENGRLFSQPTTKNHFQFLIFVVSAMFQMLLP
jgi:hypothetical protein